MHLKLLESDDKTEYECMICSLPFANVDLLIDHMKSIHIEELPFICVDCGKAFASKRDLQVHVKIHRKNFACPENECGKIFDRPQKLSDHTRAVHTKEKPIGCDLCGKDFHSTKSLSRHKKFSCKVKKESCDDEHFGLDPLVIDKLDSDP